MNETDVAARLAEALRGQLWVTESDPWDDGPVARQRSEEELAAALLPVVREIANHRAAEQAAEAARLRAERDEARAEWHRQRERADQFRYRLSRLLDGEAMDA